MAWGPQRALHNQWSPQATKCPFPWPVKSEPALSNRILVRTLHCGLKGAGQPQH